MLWMSASELISVSWQPTLQIKSAVSVGIVIVYVWNLGNNIPKKTAGHNRAKQF